MYLVNNAGITLDNLSIRLSEENWKKVLDINLTSSFLMCKNVIKKMLKKYGKIINITSIVGHTGQFRSGKLLCFKSRNSCIFKEFSTRVCKKKYKYQLCFTWIYKNRNDR